MEKFITDERTGLRYELVGDYYLIAGEDEPEGRPVGIWRQRLCRYIRRYKRHLYSGLHDKRQYLRKCHNLMRKIIKYHLFFLS